MSLTHTTTCCPCCHGILTLIIHLLRRIEHLQDSIKQVSSQKLEAGQQVAELQARLDAVEASNSKLLKQLQEQHRQRDDDAQSKAALVDRLQQAETLLAVSKATASQQQVLLAELSNKHQEAVIRAEEALRQAAPAVTCSAACQTEALQNHTDEHAKMDAYCQTEHTDDVFAANNPATATVATHTTAVPADAKPQASHAAVTAAAAATVTSQGQLHAEHNGTIIAGAEHRTTVSDGDNKGATGSAGISTAAGQPCVPAEHARPHTATDASARSLLANQHCSITAAAAAAAATQVPASSPRAPAPGLPASISLQAATSSPVLQHMYPEAVQQLQKQQLSPKLYVTPTTAGTPDRRLTTSAAQIGPSASPVLQQTMPPRQPQHMPHERSPQMQPPQPHLRSGQGLKRSTSGAASLQPASPAAKASASDVIAQSHAHKRSRLSATARPSSPEHQAVRAADVQHGKMKVADASSLAPASNEMSVKPTCSMAGAAPLLPPAASSASALASRESTERGSGAGSRLGAARVSGGVQGKARPASLSALQSLISTGMTRRASGGTHVLPAAAAAAAAVCSSVAAVAGAATGDSATGEHSTAAAARTDHVVQQDRPAQAGIAPGGGMMEHTSTAAAASSDARAGQGDLQPGASSNAKAGVMGMLFSAFAADDDAGASDDD